MAVTYDNAVKVRGSGVTTVTTGAFTISASANRAAALGFAFDANISSLTASCGGATAAQILNANYDTVVKVWLWGATAPASGSQTATASWTTSSFMALGVVTAIGVDQTTSFTNGGNSNGASPLSLAVTSTSGDLTVTAYATENEDTATTTNQTKRTVDDLVGLDTGPGSGTTTHTWTFSGSTAGRIAGANFKAVAAASGDISAACLQASAGLLLFRAGRA